MTCFLAWFSYLLSSYSGTLLGNTRFYLAHRYLTRYGIDGFVLIRSGSSSSSTGAIAGGVAAGAALLFAIPAIGFAYWRRRKPQEHFFDVPGKHSVAASMRKITCKMTVA